MHRCRMTRTSLASDGNPAQGRPLGLLMAWLVMTEPLPCSREEHCMDFLVFTLAYEKRAMCRDLLMALPGAAALAKHERKQREHEGPEPHDYA